MIPGLLSLPEGKHNRTDHRQRTVDNRQVLQGRASQASEDCDQLIDIGDNIQRCKDRCTDAYIIWMALRQNMPGERFAGMQAPTDPRNNAPIMRRGVEEEPSHPPEEQGKLRRRRRGE